MKRFSIILISLFLISLIIFLVVSNNSEIQKFAEKAGNDLEYSNTLFLKSGAHVITKKSDISQREYSNILINLSNATLKLEGISNDEYLLKIRNFSIGKNGGELQIICNNNYKGLYLTGSLFQKNGKIIAIGGENTTSTAIIIEGFFVQDDGEIQVSGGKMNYSYGIGLNNYFIQNGGLFISSGGEGKESIGSSINNLIQNGGRVISTGSTIENSTYGIRARSIIQNSGEISATGGYDESHGIDLSGSYIQNGGVLQSSGGDFQYSCGVVISGSLNQKSGSIFVEGGVGENANGLIAYQDIELFDSTTISRKGMAPSIYANYISLKSGSTLKLIVDLEKIDDLSSGLIKAEEGIYIEERTNINPIFMNTSELKKGDTARKIIFKSNFCGSYYIGKFDISYENYNFREVKLDEENNRWEVTYDLTKEGYIKLFGYTMNLFTNIISSTETERITPITFYVNKDNSEIASIRIGSVLVVTGDRE